MEQFNGASEEEKTAAKGYLNDCADEFGDQFYDSRQFAAMAWADALEEDRDKIAAYIKENMLSLDEWEQPKQELDQQWRRLRPLISQGEVACLKLLHILSYDSALFGF